ncbi:MAG: rhodanese-like domain-containing protein [Candidatus Pacebacteria bacterium]|jgi:phage shock protein E|nr:rhodanese-like domain-containing protein [Candidatus Paceibacterota bacterium]
MIIIDVRTKEEYDAGHIEGAMLHDIMDMMQGKFPSVGKDEEITLYCESGNRSMMAKNFMEQAGFTKVFDGGAMEDLRNKL